MDHNTLSTSILGGVVDAALAADAVEGYATPPQPTPTVQIVRGIGVPKGPIERAREAKRARRSEIERLSRLRRSGQYGSMREEVARLEKLQAQLTLEHEARAKHLSSDRVEARKEQFLRVVNEVRRLRAEQSRLQNMLHEQALFASSLQETVENFIEEEAVTWDQALTAWIDPLTMNDAIAVMRESCEIAATFDRGGPWQSTGGLFMGWRDKRKLVASTSTMIHRFTKLFPMRSALELLDISWRMFCTDWFYQKTIVNSSTRVRIHVLQKLNDSIWVVRRQTKYEMMPEKSFHTVYVMFRIHIENGFAICFKSIDQHEIRRSLGENESWVDVYHWITFTHADDDDNESDADDNDDGRRGCEVSFGGTINSGVLSFAHHWLIESALAVVRWETACVAPLFILPSSDGGVEGRDGAAS